MLNDIEQKLARLDKHFRDTSHDWSERERLFGRITKLNEEVGELCEAALFEHDVAQQHKTTKAIDFDSELADVIIVALLIARSRDKNIWDGIDNKLEEIMLKLNI